MLSASRDVKWMQTYEQLLVWLQSHDGFPRHNSDSAEEKALAKWINNRRTAYSTGRFPKAEKNFWQHCPGGLGTHILVFGMGPLESCKLGCGRTIMCTLAETAKTLQSGVWANGDTTN